MVIIGCDFHSSFQQIAVLDTESGECEEHKLMYAKVVKIGSKEPAIDCGYLIDTFGQHWEYLRVCGEIHDLYLSVISAITGGWRASLLRKLLP